MYDEDILNSIVLQWIIVVSPILLVGIVGLIAYHFVLFVKRLSEQDNLDIISTWIREAVYAVDQPIEDDFGEEKKQ